MTHPRTASNGRGIEDGAERVVDLSHRLLTPADVAELLCLPASTIYELARSGRLPCLRIGRAVRFEQRDLESYLVQTRRR